MKAASTALINLLLTGSFVIADLYTFSLVGGIVIRLTTADRDVTVSGQTWVSTGPYIDADPNGSGRVQKSTADQKIGLDVDQRTIAVMPRTIDPISGAAFPDRIGSQPWIVAVAAGALDGAEVQVDRAYWPAPWAPLTSPVGTPTGIVSAVFSGRVADIAFDRGVVSITINSHLELLTQQIPRNFYGPSCVHTLFDSGCTLSASRFAVNGTVASVRAQNIIVSSIAAPPGSGTYTLGRIVFTSGLNQGIARMVRKWDATTGTFSLIAPLPFTVQINDGFVGYPGCDKLQSTCTKFANSPNFGGTPYVPQYATAV